MRTRTSLMTLLHTVTPRDSSRDISLSQLFYLKSFPHFSSFSAHRTSPHFSVSFRTSPCFTFPCLPLSYYGYSPVLTFPCRTVHWLLRYSLCNPYIRYSVHTRY